MKRVFEYKDTHTIKNGTTTIVNGEIRIRDYQREKIQREVVKVKNLCAGMGYDYFCEPIKCKGVAQPTPNDTYDEKTGRVLASRKAELNCIRKLYKQDAAVEVELINLLQLIRQNMLDEKDRKDLLFTQIGKMGDTNPSIK